MVRSVFATQPSDFSPFIEIYRDFGVENTLEETQALQGCVVETEGSQSIIDELTEALKTSGVDEVFVEPYQEQDWELTWKQFFKPRRIGKRLLIVPSWETVESNPDDVVLVLDPGQAFGTGDHPTTRLCLELLEQINLTGLRVADVGCGSGILAIAAVKLGANVLAVDIDEIALQVAKENATRNGVDLITYCGDGLFKLNERPDLTKIPQDESPLPITTLHSVRGEPQAEQFHIVVSNIISATLIRLAEQLTSVLLPGGHWIVSGIIEQNWPEVRAEAEKFGLVLKIDLHEDGWVAADFIKA